MCVGKYFIVHWPSHREYCDEDFLARIHFIVLGIAYDALLHKKQQVFLSFSCNAM